MRIEVHFDVEELPESCYVSSYEALKKCYSDVLRRIVDELRSVVDRLGKVSDFTMDIRSNDVLLVKNNEIIAKLYGDDEELVVEL